MVSALVAIEFLVISTIFLLFSLLPAYIQSDSKATEAEKSYSYVAAEVGQGTVVYY